jgi:hypothetical protein
MSKVESLKVESQKKPQIRKLNICESAVKKNLSKVESLNVEGPNGVLSSPTTNNQQPKNLQPIVLHRFPVFVKHITQTN